jgi:hypothetical protein
MGIFSRVYDAYVSLATQNGSIHDGGTVFMFAAAALIVLLSIYLAYNMAAMTIDGARSAYRAGRWVLASATGESSNRTMPIEIHSAA